MPPIRFPVAVIFQRTPLSNRWVSERWEPIAVETEDTPSTTVAVKIADDESGTRWRFGGQLFELHPCEAEGYYLNLTSADPKVFVMWRMADSGVEPAVFPVIVTVSYNQAARMLDGGEQVDAVPMPPNVMASMKPFVDEHYKPESRKKVRRNDPFRDNDEQRGRAPRH